MLKVENSASCSLSSATIEREKPAGERQTLGETRATWEAHVKLVGEGQASLTTLGFVRGALHKQHDRRGVDEPAQLVVQILAANGGRRHGEGEEQVGDGLFATVVAMVVAMARHEQKRYAAPPWEPPLPWAERRPAQPVIWRHKGSTR
jgi:hypothetical protein